MIEDLRDNVQLRALLPAKFTLLQLLVQTEQRCLVDVGARELTEDFLTASCLLTTVNFTHSLSFNTRKPCNGI